MIFCFSGTGNSLWAARLLAQETNDEVCMMTGEKPERIDEICAKAQAIGFVFPVYGWNMPAAVRDFIARLPYWKNGERPYVYALLTCGDDTGRTDRELSRALKERGWILNAAFSVRLRNTYVCLPGFNTDSTELEEEKRAAAQRTISTRIADAVNRKAPSSSSDIHYGSFPWLKTYVIGKLFHKFLTSPHGFRVDENKCRKCGRCQQVCPLENIAHTESGAPLWGERCTLCMACYHSCPCHAIAHGRFTKGKGQVRVTENRIRHELP